MCVKNVNLFLMNVNDQDHSEKVIKLDPHKLFIRELKQMAIDFVDSDMD